MPFNPLPVAAGQCPDTGIRLTDQDAMHCLLPFQNGAAFLLGEGPRMGDFNDQGNTIFPVGETNHAPVLYRFHPVRPDNTPGALHLLQRMPLKPFR